MSALEANAWEVEVSASLIYEMTYEKDWVMMTLEVVTLVEERLVEVTLEGFCGLNPYCLYR